MPWDGGTPLRAVLAHPFGDHGYTQTDTLISLLTSHPHVASLTVLGREPTADATLLLQSATQAAGTANLVVLLTKPDVWPEFGIPAWQCQLIQHLTERAVTVVVSLGVPDALTYYHRAALRLATFSDSPVSQRALVSRLFAH